VTVAKARQAVAVLVPFDDFFFELLGHPLGEGAAGEHALGRRKRSLWGTLTRPTWAARNSPA